MSTSRSHFHLFPLRVWSESFDPCVWFQIVKKLNRNCFQVAFHFKIENAKKKTKEKHPHVCNNTTSRTHTTRRPAT